MQSKQKALAFAVFAVAVVVLAMVPVSDVSADDDSSVGVSYTVGTSSSFVTLTFDPDNKPTENGTLYIYDAQGNEVASKAVLIQGQTTVSNIRFSGLALDDTYMYRIVGDSGAVLYDSRAVQPVVEEYTVTVSDEIVNGTVVADADKAEAGDKVTLTVTPADGYKTKGVAFNGTAITAVEGVYSFIMPDQDVTVTATFEADEAPVEPGQVLDIVSVGYAAENANATINAALEAAGYEGAPVTDADPAAVVFIVFKMELDGTIDFSIDGVELKSFDFAAGVHAIYATDDSYVAGQTITLGIADGDASDSITYTFVAGTPSVEPDPVEPTVEYSTDIRAAITADGHLLLVAEDGKAIPSGTVTVTYTYTAERIYFGVTTHTSVTASFAQDYASDGKAHAIIALDFEDKAAANYAAIAGASADFAAADGSVDAHADQVSLALPPITARA